jgi:RimJ/RimL family protein N-acetyltransferase
MEYEQIPIGSIRFDTYEGEATISYLIDSEYHGQGFGHIILKKGIEYILAVNISAVKPITVLIGDVMKTNRASFRAFERLGFTKEEKRDKFRYQKWI